jgi:hypothetical protein
LEHPHWVIKMAVSCLDFSFRFGMGF